MSARWLDFTASSVRSHARRSSRLPPPKETALSASGELSCQHNHGRFCQQGLVHPCCAGIFRRFMTSADALHVITDTDRRGAQVFGLDLAEALRRRGHAADIVALASGRFGNALPVPVLGSSRLGRPTLRALRSAMRKASVVVAHGSSTLPACTIASAGLGVPVIYRQISDSMFWADTHLRRLRVRLYLGRMQRVVALWSGSASTLTTRLGVPATKITVIPNGVPAARCGQPSESARQDARRRFGLDLTAPTVTYVGALVPEKGVSVALAAAAMLPSVQFLIVGDGSERQALETTAQATPQARITFAGTVIDPMDAYAAADVVVLPSLGGDSMPAVLIEAGLCGRAAVATPVAAITDIVIDGKTGRIVPIGDAGALAEGIQQALGARMELGAAARRHCLEHFEIDVVAEAWERVIKEVRSAPSEGRTDR